jgi:hypothetical protein
MNRVQERTMSAVAAPSLAGLMPLKVGGRHYGDNLARVNLLFSSLLHFAAPGLLDEIVVVVRSDEAELIGRHIAQWPDLPVRIVVEDDHFPAFQRYTRPWQLRPWQRQQIIKLNAPAFVDAEFVLMLDPDVMAIKPLNRALLVGEGRALLEPESREVHRQWWLDSADLLEVSPGLERPGMNVTPAVLSTAVLRELHRRLEAVGGRPWMDVLLTSYCNWTEYTLYLLAAEASGLEQRYHLWADDPRAPAHLHTDPATSIWDAEHATPSNVERLFAEQDPGLFAVVQSNTGLPASEIAAVANRHFPVRDTSVEPAPPCHTRSKFNEKATIIARLAAQRVYRLRRRLRQTAGRPHIT